MSESFLEIDHVPEGDLPPHASDGRTGDRLSFLEAGLLHVEGGRATLVRWSDVLGTLEHLGRAYVLVARRAPRPPWLEIDERLLGGGSDAVPTFLGRLNERNRGGGYRDPVRQRRQGIDAATLRSKVGAREAVPGALEVPSTIRLGSSGHPLEGPAIASLIMGGGAAGYGVTVGGLAVMESARAMRTLDVLAPAIDLMTLAAAFAPYLGLVLGGWVGWRLRDAWRASREAGVPRQRVLVLAPDGCVIGFRTGVQTLEWSQVGSFGIGPTEPHHEDGLVVRSTNGRKLGDIDRGWLDAPLELVVKVAEVYREAAV